ncbi:hypothetical protein GY12_09100 [Micrococcus luteus]|nr:hypothetical protein GY12_09100 [Micrococcus luteus]
MHFRQEWPSGLAALGVLDIDRIVLRVPAKALPHQADGLLHALGEDFRARGLGIDGGTVRMIERKWRGTREWLMRRRCDGLFICINAWPSTSQSMKVINELRE